MLEHHRHSRTLPDHQHSAERETVIKDREHSSMNLKTNGGIVSYQAQIDTFQHYKM